MSEAGLASTATQRAPARAVDLDDVGADQLVGPERVGIVERFGVQRLVGEPLRRRAVGDLLRT